MPKGRILAVDDQRYFRELIEGLLAEEGFDAQTAASGDEALRILEHATFDVVLTDLVMPGMDGSELVHRIKQRFPDQEIVVVTGVVDVKTAVDAMKLGATDYLLKPFDRNTLATALESILQRRRLREEHTRLLAENIEYIGERSLLERALGLYACLSIEPLADLIVEALCLETRAQGGVAWMATGPKGLCLTAARGLVRVEEEPELLSADNVPPALRKGGASSTLERWASAGPGEASGGWACCLALRRDGEMIGLVRLTDKLGGDEFDPVDRRGAEKLARFAEGALANALRFAELERRSLKDPRTGAYTQEYLQEALRNEIEKAKRFGRQLSLLQLDLSPLDPLSQQWDEAELERWLAELAKHVRRRMRASDLFAIEGASRFRVLLPEVGALGAATLKARVREALEESELFTALDSAARPSLFLGAATFPSDGAQTETLLSTLETRVQEERNSPVHGLGLERLGFAEGLRVLLRQGEWERPELAEQIARFVFAEVVRRPRDRSWLFAAAGDALGRGLRAGLEALRGVTVETEVVVMGEGPEPEAPEVSVTWASPRRVPGVPPFVIHYGEGPPYALVADEKPGPEGLRVFHTSHRSLVEHLAFRLRRELALPAPSAPSGSARGGTR